jgi:tetratricopeptide (TPR) repeat protein
MKHLLTIIALLLALTCCTTESDRLRMRAGLDGINQCNRNDRPFTVSDVQPYVAFFDDHGTPNDRLLAHYLLGRAYHEHGEAPMALQCYHDAIDCADTTAADCDYAQLARVYGQMGDIFYNQGLYYEQISAMASASKYAWKGKDTLTALVEYEQLSSAYKELGQIDSAIAIKENVAALYTQYNMDSYAAIALGSIIGMLLENKEYDKAENYARLYETKSGLFDDSGYIKSGWEIYYFLRGSFFLKQDKVDSAELYFRRLLETDKSYNGLNAAYLGLARMYEQRNIPDSAILYYKKAYAMNDSLYAQRTTKEVERMQAMYDYGRHQQIAHQKIMEAQKEKEAREFLAIVLIVFILLSIWYVIETLKRKKAYLLKYKETLEYLRQIKSEKNALEKHEEEYCQIISEKEKIIEQGKKIIKRYGKLQYFTTANAERCLKESTSYFILQQKAIRGEILTEKDWEAISILIKEYFPGFDDFLETHNFELNDIESKVCLLIRLHIKPTSIAGCLSVSKSKISQVCTVIMKKLFQEKGSSKELSSKLSKIF